MGTKRLLAVMVVLALFGCAGAGIRPSGFLSNYEALKEDAQEKGIYWWEKDRTTFKGYGRLILEPVEVRVDAEKAERRMSEEEMGKLAATLREYVREEVKDRYPVVDMPAPDVLRLRAAITHLKPVNPAINIASTAAIFIPIDVGEVTVEAQFIDSVKGTVLGELIATRRGSMADVAGVWTRWSQVESALKYWAKLLRDALDETQR